jgi:hypothetical protein
MVLGISADNRYPAPAHDQPQDEAMPRTNTRTRRRDEAVLIGPAAGAVDRIRKFGADSATAILHELDDEPRFRELERLIHDRFQPRSPLEAFLCARMAAALWRAERADLLEAQHWCLLPPDVSSKEELRMARILVDDEIGKRRNLATILRYQTEAMNAFDRALRTLTLLRAQYPQPPAPPPPANQDDAVATLAADEANRTNEPEPPPPAVAQSREIPEEPAEAVRFATWSAACRSRIEAFADGESPAPASLSGPFCTNEPEPAP